MGLPCRPRRILPVDALAQNKCDKDIALGTTWNHHGQDAPGVTALFVSNQEIGALGSGGFSLGDSAAAAAANPTDYL